MLCPAGQTKRNNLTEKALICLVKALFTRAYIRNYAVLVRTVQHRRGSLYARVYT